MAKKYILGGTGTLRPYLYVGMDMIDFVKDVFGAVIEDKHEWPGGCHVEARIGDTPFVMEAAEEFPSNVETTQGAVYLYVEDVDATYSKAIESGATSISEPEDKPYGDRGCGIKDSSGNVWWIATHIANG